MKQYGLIVMHTDTKSTEAFYGVWDDLRLTIDEVVVEADDLECNRSHAPVAQLFPRPEAIFEYDPETGLFSTAVSGKDLYKLLVNMDDDRERKSRENLSDADRKDEDACTRVGNRTVAQLDADDNHGG